MTSPLPYSTLVLYIYTEMLTLTHKYMEGEKHICMHILNCLFHNIVHNQLARKCVTCIFTNSYSPFEILFALEHVLKMSFN